MLRSWKLGTAFGIGIYVHWTFLLLPVLVLFGNLDSGWLMALYGVTLLLAVFACVILHELGHALMARRFGIPTMDITMYPIGGIARLGGPGARGLGERPWEEFWIALAGPAVNVAIAGLLAGVLTMTGAALDPSIEQWKNFTPGEQFLFGLFYANRFLVLFNLLPAFPMDGGRVLRALLAMRLGYLKATEVAATIGMFMAGLFIFAGFGGLAFTGFYFLQGSPVLVLVAMFVFLAGQQELAVLRFKARRQEMERQGLWRPGWNGQPLDEIDLQPVAPLDGDGAAVQPFHVDPAAVPAEANFSGFTWDRRAGAWIEWRNGQPVHVCWTR